MINVILPALLNQRAAASGIKPQYVYGFLYNWYAASDDRIVNAYSGFAVANGTTSLQHPLVDDWNILEKHVNDHYNVAPNNFGTGNHRKSKRQINTPIGGEWNTDTFPRWNSNATHYGRDTVNFGVLPNGFRNQDGVFSQLHSTANLHSKSGAYIEYRSHEGITRTGEVMYRRGCGIRLVKKALQNEMLIPENQIIPNYYKGNNNFLYDCVRIGTQIWTVQNLCETKYNDGTSIPYVQSGLQWSSISTGAYCAYNNDISFAYREGVFVFNGAEYGLVTSNTGRVWLDRNLGAERVAQASNDARAYGFLYQWGRGSDGHQFRTSGMRNAQSATDDPGHSNFIVGFENWRNPPNLDLWQGINCLNNIAPPIFRLPTIAEWEAERVTWMTNNIEGAFNSKLKLTSTGHRQINGGFSTQTIMWSSTLLNQSPMRLLISPTNSETSFNAHPGIGTAIRLIRD